MLALVDAKGHLKPKLTKRSTTIGLRLLLNLCQRSIGTEICHFQPFPAVHGPGSDHDPLSPLYVVLELLNLF